LPNEFLETAGHVKRIPPENALCINHRLLGLSDTTCASGAVETLLPSMTPALFVERGSEAFRRRAIIVAGVALGAWHAGATAAAGVLAFPWSFGVIFAHQAAVLAKRNIS
jgi:hypothetical protein